MIYNMRLALSFYLLGLAYIATAADSNSEPNLAGYNTSRIGPVNANCQRQTYQLNITSNNTVFTSVDSNANQVRTPRLPPITQGWLTNI
jgi:hypothetical protein